MNLILTLAAIGGGSLSLFSLVVILALIGVGVWALTTYVPMAPPFKRIITIVAILVAIYLVLVFFGVWDDIRSI
jgi:hypothetical protein